MKNANTLTGLIEIIGCFVALWLARSRRWCCWPQVPARSRNTDTAKRYQRTKARVVGYACGKTQGARQVELKTSDEEKAAKKHCAGRQAGRPRKHPAEPDKVLYDRAQADLKAWPLHGRTAGTADPDQHLSGQRVSGESETGGGRFVFQRRRHVNLTQSIQEYNDFQTFFPFLDEAAYAQMQIGLAHYHMMEKADRDKTQGEAAEDAFQAFLLKYPTNALAPKATQYLRDVQEILADGEYKVAYFYYAKLDYRASAARLVELTDRYPLYSQNDEALWLLGDVYERAKTLSKNEDDKSHWGDLAAKCYDKIVRDYPMSKLVPAAKSRLKGMGRPIPEADPDAYARMKQEQLYQHQHHQIMALKMPMSMLKGDPDFQHGRAWRNAAAESPE